MQRGYDEDWLGDTFSRAVMLGNGLVAILSGLLANTLVEPMALGPVAPFDAAAVLLAVGGTIIFLSWGENYGNSASSHSMVAQFSEALHCISNDRKVFLLGLMQVPNPAHPHTRRCYPPRPCRVAQLRLHPASPVARLPHGDHAAARCRKPGCLVSRSPAVCQGRHARVSRTCAG